MSQQIRIHGIRRMRSARVFPSVNGLNAHVTHKPSDPSSSDPEEILLPQEIAQHPGARKGILQMQSIALGHNQTICPRGPKRAPEGGNTPSIKQYNTQILACRVTDSLRPGRVIFLRSVIPL